MRWIAYKSVLSCLQYNQFSVRNKRELHLKGVHDVNLSYNDELVTVLICFRRFTRFTSLWHKDRILFQSVKLLSLQKI